MKTFLIVVLSLMLTGTTVWSGNIQPELRQKMISVDDIELIPVWIKPVDLQESSTFKAEVTQVSTNRQERYTYALTQLKERRQSSQARIMHAFASMAASKSNRKTKQHWLINIISTELTKSEIETLAARTDIESIYAVPKVETIPSEKPTPSKSTAGVEDNLTYINAPTAWHSLGYDGSGRVVCSFDTGVEGVHPALIDGWKGHDGDSAAAWFDPVKLQSFPHTVPDCGLQGCRTSHGTHTLGIMVGVDNSSGDTVGVAPGAKWIAAAVIDIAGATILDAFEWAADPDGNPNTIDDVPDVINHSWGIKNVDCDDLFYDMIDYTEALGIVNIFSAGNEGSGAYSIRNPANRANDSLDCFAVGNVLHPTGTIVPSSSRGPSSCPLTGIKPNVVAPGQGIRSTVPGGGYADNSGTSMAAPHVSGLVALLRQKNPNATVDEIKEAILAGAQDLGQMVPNNDIGWGRIDCVESLNTLASPINEPYLRLSAFDLNTAAAPGSTVTGTIRLLNTGSTASNVNGFLLSGNPSITINSGALNFGTVPAGDTVRAPGTVSLTISDTVTVGQILSMEMELTGIGYSDTVKVYLLFEPVAEKGTLTHTAGNIKFTVSNYGTYGLSDDSFYPLGGTGFRHNANGNDLWEGGLITGQNMFKVSDGVRNNAGEPDNDFQVAPNGNIRFVTPKPGVTEQSYARFTDERAESPMGLDIEQHVYSFNTGIYADMLITQYILTNTTGGLLSNVLVGLYMDWDIVSYTANIGGYNSIDSLSWMAYVSGSEQSKFRGIKIIDGELFSSFTKQGSYSSFPSLGGVGLTEQEKYNALIDGFVTADSFSNPLVLNDLLQMASARVNLLAGGKDTVTFALLAGETYAEIQTLAQGASTIYEGVITNISDNGGGTGLPQTYTLYQNYPNPFNPTTTIRFSLPIKSMYVLEIFSVDGRKVFGVEGEASAGTTEIEWNAASYGSGVYLYRLTADDFTDSKKMILLK